MCVFGGLHQTPGHQTIIMTHRRLAEIVHMNGQGDFREKLRVGEDGAVGVQLQVIQWEENLDDSPTPETWTLP